MDEFVVEIPARINVCDLNERPVVSLIYTFYVFFREKYIDEKKLYVLIFILVAFTSVEYFKHQKEQM